MLFVTVFGFDVEAAFFAAAPLPIPKRDSFLVFAGDGVEAFALGAVGGALSFFVLLPDGMLASLLSAFTVSLVTFFIVEAGSSLDLLTTGSFFFSVDLSSSALLKIV